ncbi:hypothetical protein ABIF69_007577 [Bradyrhizobium japonicum]
MAQPKEQTKAVLVRLPADVKVWLENEARKTFASQNSEIVRCIRARMDADPPRKAANAGET